MIEIPKALLADISSRKDKDIYMIAIDGCGGAGKSTCAEKLAAVLSNTQIVHIDAFYKPREQRVEVTEKTSVHVNFEFDRLKQQVIEPLKQGKIATYQTPRGEHVEVRPSGFIIIEGLGTLGPELSRYFDYKIWIDSPEATRRGRGIERDTQAWTKIWDDEYLPQDARYMNELRPQDQADWVLNNN
jgi:uridine kinase